MSKLRTLLRPNFCEEVLSSMGDQVVGVAASLPVLEGQTGTPVSDDFLRWNLRSRTVMFCQGGKLPAIQHDVNQ